MIFGISFYILSILFVYLNVYPLFMYVSVILFIFNLCHRACFIFYVTNFILRIRCFLVFLTTIS